MAASGNVVCPTLPGGRGQASVGVMISGRWPSAGIAADVALRPDADWLAAGISRTIGRLPAVGRPQADREEPEGSMARSCSR